jgi:two-component system response regulator PilR (NtrC family)
MQEPSTNGELKVASEIPSEGLDLESLINGIERELLVKALARSGGVKKEAARLLKLNARSLRYRLDKYEITLGNGANAGPDEDEGEEGG